MRKNARLNYLLFDAIGRGLHDMVETHGLPAPAKAVSRKLVKYINAYLEPIEVTRSDALGIREAAIAIQRCIVGRYTNDTRAELACIMAMAHDFACILRDRGVQAVADMFFHIEEQTFKVYCMVDRCLHDKPAMDLGEKQAAHILYTAMLNI